MLELQQQLAEELAKRKCLGRASFEPLSLQNLTLPNPKHISSTFPRQAQYELIAKAGWHSEIVLGALSLSLVIHYFIVIIIYFYFCFFFFFFFFSLSLSLFSHRIVYSITHSPLAHSHTHSLHSLTFSLSHFLTFSFSLSLFFCLPSL